MQMSKNRMNVAIDGPAGAGKSTVARMVADELGYVYIDTGAMYRAVTYSALKAGIAPAQADDIASLAARLDIRLEPGRDGQLVFVDGEDVTDAIRSHLIATNVSQVAKIAAVRATLVKQQQRIASRGGVVMDGRDIGSRVLPDAGVKIYLTASIEERARRRYEEMLAKGSDVDYETLLQDISERDETDQNRSESPLVIAEDAIILDTTHMQIEEVVRSIVELCRIRMGEE